jgi:chromosome segregation ATPase
MTIPALLARLKQHEASLGDGRDARSENEKADWFAATRTCAQTISGLMNAPSDLAREQTRLDDLEQRRAATVAKIAEVEQAIVDAPDWHEHPDARERDRRHDHVQHLRRQLEHLHEGTLFQAPGVYYDRVDAMNQWIAEATVRRDRAQAALDSTIAQAEALLAATVTS